MHRTFCRCPTARRTSHGRSLMRQGRLFRSGKQAGQRLAARDAEGTISAWRSWWTNTAASRDWSRSKTWSRRSWAKFGDEHEKPRDRHAKTISSFIVPGNMDVDRLDELFGMRPGRKGVSDHRRSGERTGRTNSPKRARSSKKTACASKCWTRPTGKVERVRVTRCSLGR